MNCPKCGEKSRNNGRTKNEVQKYECKNKDCKFSYTENHLEGDSAYTKTEMRLLAMLYGFLEAQPDERLSLKQYLEKARNSYAHLKKPKFRVFQQKFNEPLEFSDNSVQLLISVHNNEISLVKFNQPIFDKEILDINGKVAIKNINKKNPKPKKRHYMRIYPEHQNYDSYLKKTYKDDEDQYY